MPHSSPLLHGLILSWAILTMASCASSSPKQAPALASDAPSLTLMTYNVNYGIAGDADTIHAISSSGAELILLQKTTPAWEQSLREKLSTQYPHMHFAHCCGAGGLAILSTHPFEVLDTLDPPQGGWFPAMLLRADTSLGPVEILQVHLRPPLSDSGNVLLGYLSTPKVRELEIAHYIDQITSQHNALPTLVVGDFNEDDGRAIKHLDTHGMKSVLPELSPDQHTWRWHTSLGQITQRLDHVVYDPSALTPHTARVINAGRSDHLPIVATFSRR
jgi:endonuclease/exonuclease/phosphatase (EEP) superfamily protein YafD